METFFELHRELDSMLCCFKQKNNYCAGNHFHSNIEVLYVISGEIEAIIGGKSRILTANCACIASSYDSHNYISHKDSEVYILIIPSDSIGEFNVLSRNMLFKDNFLLECERSVQLKAALENLLEFHETRDLFLPKGYIYTILGIFIEQLGLVKRQAKVTSNVLMRDILIHMEEHFQEDISIDDLAKKFGYNKDYLSHLINKNLGFGFKYYLNQIRIRFAAQLLRNTAESIGMSEVADSSGYSNIRTFNRVFKEFYQISPKDYKRKFRNPQK